MTNPTSQQSSSQELSGATSATIDGLGKSAGFSIYLNYFRWFSLTLVFAMLILIPLLGIYQTFVAAHAYDLLTSNEKAIYDAMEWISDPFVNRAENDLDALKGTTWSGTLFNLKLSDPLAVLGFTVTNKTFYSAFAATAIIPVVLTLFFGRFYCGWICPATFLYELNSNFAAALRSLGYSFGNRRFDRRIKYLVLIALLIASTITGTILVGVIYPPAIVGRELYYAIAMNGFGFGAVVLFLTFLFDLFVARRGFCRYLCPGGALFSVLGRYRAVRVQRNVQLCNDCTMCNSVCEFALSPMSDDIGQECNNCTACIAVCPTKALHLTIKLTDITDQGPGHLGRAFRKNQEELNETP